MGPRDAPGGPPARRRIPPQDLVVIGRRPRASTSGDAPAPPVRVVPRISRRRVAFRVLLVAALIGEIALAVRIWPRDPVHVPDASVSTNMIA